MWHLDIAWYRDKLEALAKTRWKKRSLRFKSDERMRPEAQQQVVESMEADPQGRKLRAFLKGVWHIFRDSRDAQAARQALEALQQLQLAPTARAYTGRSSPSWRSAAM